MLRPKIHKRNPLGITELDPLLLTPNEAWAQKLRSIERGLRVVERRIQQYPTDHRRRQDDR